MGIYTYEKNGLRVQILSAGIIRTEEAVDGAFVDAPTLLVPDRSAFCGTAVTESADGDTTVLATDRFTVRIAGNTAADVTVFANGKSVRLTAIADTGNSLEDGFGKSEVIIADLLSVKVLFGNLEVENNVGLKRRYQILPCSTVLGDSFLESFRCDSAIVECEGKKITLAKPLLAISKTGFNDDYNAIINPKILR